MSHIFTRLLLATEHTEFDRGAENLAIHMAQRCRLPLATVFPLLSNPEFEALAPEIATRAEQDAALKIANIRQLAESSGVTINLRVRRGAEPYQEIVAEARETGTELIILRRRGKRSFLANLLVGEMVSKVLAHAPCHVLFAPRESRMWSQRVLVAAEPGAQGLRLVKTALAVAAECGLPLHLVHIASSEQQAAEVDTFFAQCQTQARQSSVPLQTEVRRGKVYAEILTCAVQQHADLLVIGSRSDPHIGRAMIGGTAQKLIGLAEIPVMALNLA